LSGSKHDPVGTLLDKLRSHFGLGTHSKDKYGLPPKMRFSLWYVIVALILFSYLQPLMFSGKVEPIPLIDKSYPHTGRQFVKNRG
jgi:cell division protease FtsH